MSRSENMIFLFSKVIQQMQHANNKNTHSLAFVDFLDIWEYILLKQIRMEYYQPCEMPIIDYILLKSQQDNNIQSFFGAGPRRRRGGGVSNCFQLFVEFLRRNQTRVNLDMYFPILFLWFDRFIGNYDSFEFKSLMELLGLALNDRAVRINKIPKDKKHQQLQGQSAESQLSDYYPSSIEIKNKKSLSWLARHLFGMKNKTFIKNVLNARIEMLCNDPNDHKKKFYRKVDREVLLLNFMIRSYTGMKLNTRDRSVFPINLELFNEVEELLDSVTLFKTNVYLDRPSRADDTTSAENNDEVNENQLAATISDEELNHAVDTMLDSKTDVKYMTVDEYYDDAFNIDTAECHRRW
ncbi:unnamed protein product [Ambrosiozyma monospora]|uniref:Unnamed protein product n=1 Tax=Ambrosiozyma monospora TaxID=43982 RepID=A0ACB5U687_AMBMO|nr:unnamed protein product [Ambrosiozyma monospora]